MKRMIVITVSLLFLASLFTPLVQGSMSQTGVSLYIDGPDNVFVEETEDFAVEIRGSFSEEATNWSYEIVDVPLELYIDPVEDESSETNRFEFTVTATTTGTFSFTIVGYCSDDEETRYRESTFELTSHKPIETSVEVENTSGYDLEDVLVGLFIDGELVQTKTIDKLEVNETKTVEFMWIKEDLEAGKHRLEIRADFGLHEEPEFGEELLTKEFYVEGEPSAWRFAIPIIIIAAAVFFVFYYLKKRKRRRRPW